MMGIIGNALEDWMVQTKHIPNKRLQAECIWQILPWKCLQSSILYPTSFFRHLSAKVNELVGNHQAACVNCRSTTDQIFIKSGIQFIPYDDSLHRSMKNHGWETTSPESLHTWTQATMNSEQNCETVGVWSCSFESCRELLCSWLRILMQVFQHRPGRCSDELGSSASRNPVSLYTS